MRVPLSTIRCGLEVILRSFADLVINKENKMQLNFQVVLTFPSLALRFNLHLYLENPNV